MREQLVASPYFQFYPTLKHLENRRVFFYGIHIIFIIVFGATPFLSNIGNTRVVDSQAQLIGFMFDKF